MRVALSAWRRRPDSASSVSLTIEFTTALALTTVL
jgi:hypothetical protein